MKHPLRKKSKTIFMLVIISGITLSILVAGAASSVVHDYQYVYAASENSTKSTSSSSVSSSTQEGNAILEIRNHVIADCPFTASYCPQGSNTGMETTITILNHPQTPAFFFPAGPWQAVTIKKIPVPIDAIFRIANEIKSQPSH